MGAHVKRTSYTVAGLAAVLAFTGIGAAPGQAAVTAPVDCPQPFPTPQAVDGVAGTGFTVEKGTTPAPFSADVLGRITDGIEPGTDLIMAKLSSPALTRAGGVWAGMSGSPVYSSDGRLIGAVAYVLASNTDIAGITPAESMFPLLTTASSSRARSGAGASRIAVPSAVAKKLSAQGVSRQAANEGFRRIALPLSVSGGAGAGQRKITEKFLGRIQDVRVMTGGGKASAAAAAPSTIEAGGNFVAALSYGDFTAAATGTTTFVCNGRAVAFGHPFFSSGTATYSAHTATAVYIQPDSLFGPFKVANPGGVVGTVDRDRTTGISAELGAGPRTTLITSSLAKVGGRPVTATTRATDEDFTPSAAAYHVLYSSLKALGSGGKGSASMAVKITGVRANGTPFTVAWSDRYSDTYDLPYTLGLAVYEPLSALVGQEYENARITSVDVKGTVESTVREYRVTGVTVKQGSRYVTPRTVTVAPGGRLDVRVAMESYKNIIGSRTVNLALTASRYASRTGTLEISAGRTYDSQPDTSFDTLVKALNATPQNATIRAVLRFGNGKVSSLVSAQPDQVRGYQDEWSVRSS